jgi:hypothetical protein
MGSTWTGREIARRGDGGAGGGDGRVAVRPEALRCRLRLRGLCTSDAHTLDASFTFGLRALDEKVERQMLAEAFLSDRQSVSADDVAAHFSTPLRDALARLVAHQPAEHWIADAQKKELVEALRAAAKPVAFNCGVELLPPFEAAIESPTLQREKIEQMQRKLAERRAAGQAEHVQRAAELLRQFQSLRETMPRLSPGQLLDRVNPADRGSMLETLLLSSGAQAEQTLWAVAGPNLVRIDARDAGGAAAPRADLIPLPSDLGPLRSVQAGEVDGAARLLVGAQSGVMVVDPQRPGEATRYADREIPSGLGFNSVVAAGDMIWATHGEAGVVAWRAGETDEPAVTLRGQRSPLSEADAAAAISGTAMSHGSGGSSVSMRLPGGSAQGPRNAAVLDDNRVLYSSGGGLFVVDRAGTAEPLGVPGGAAVVLIVPDRDLVAVVRASGFVERRDRQTLQPVGGEQRCGGVTAAAVLPWLGTTRLLLATEDGPVCCVGTDDSLVTQYASAHRGLRALAAAADRIAALSADRQRILIWKSWDGRAPAAELHVASLARHRVADLCFA